MEEPRTANDLRVAEKIARLLDDYHLDPLLGLLPGVGDAIGSLLGFSLVVIGWRRGMSRVTLARMLLNLGLDGLLGAIPLVGNIFDWTWRANRRNLALLHSRQAAVAQPSDWLVLGAAATVFVTGLVVPPLLCVWLVVHLLQR